MSDSQRRNANPTGKIHWNLQDQNDKWEYFIFIKRRITFLKRIDLALAKLVSAVCSFSLLKEILLTLQSPAQLGRLTQLYGLNLFLFLSFPEAFGLSH